MVNSYDIGPGAIVNVQFGETLHENVTIPCEDDNGVFVGTAQDGHSVVFALRDVTEVVRVQG